MNNAEKQDSVLRRLEVIGEAASRLSQETRDRFPGVLFRAMRGMRNIIAHDYGDVDLYLVWKTASDDVPALVETVEKPQCSAFLQFSGNHKTADP